MTPFRWLPEHVATIGDNGYSVAPVFARAIVPNILPDHDVWDHWPVLHEDGSLAEVDGGFLVIALTAPTALDPDRRHDVARMRLFHVVDRRFRDLGHVLPPPLSPGTREWAGSAVLLPGGSRIKLYFTAAGRRGEKILTYHQRLFETVADLVVTVGATALSIWEPPVESVRADGVMYQADTEGGGAIGTIKAFRDPFYFRSPTGEDLLLFTASDPRVESAWNGLVGLARRENGEWKLHPPLVSAPGLNNELERPHALVHDGGVYLFWSTQRKVFRPGGPAGPTGLYGVVADQWGAPWRPLNGTGLVFANPAAAPDQAYSFQVLPDLSMWSFADMPETNEIPADARARRERFVGGPAPVLRLRLRGEEAGLVAG